MSGNKEVNRIIGVIGKPHGIKGYTYVMLITDYPDTISKEDVLYLDKHCSKNLIIQDIKKVIYKGQSRSIFKFYGYDDFEAAESLRNFNLYRDSESQPKLKKDTHWVDELIGCSVYLAKSMADKDKSCKDFEEYIGIVEDVANYAYNDNLIIATSDGKTTIIPMYEEYVEKIDASNKKIFLKSLPEYI